MYKVAFTLIRSDPFADRDVEVDGFYKCEGRYDFGDTSGFDKLGEMHPLHLSDDYKKDARVINSMLLRGRFANETGALAGVFLLSIDDYDLFEVFEREDLQQLIDDKVESGDLQDFLTRARF